MSDDYKTNNTIEFFPNIKTAYLMMDSVLPTAKSEVDALNASEEVLGAEDVYFEDLEALDVWIGTLAENERDLMIGHDSPEQQELYELSPKNIDNYATALLFNDLYEVR